MKGTLLTSVCVATVLAIAVPASAWIENFEGYDHNDYVTDGDWVAQDHPSFVVEMSQTGYPIGYGASKGALHASATSWYNANAYRDDAAGNTLIGRLKLCPTTAASEAQLGFTTGAPPANASYWGADSASFWLRDRQGAGDYRLYFSGSGTELIGGPITNDTWYDVKMEVTPVGNAYTAAGWYKLSSSPDWVSMGSGTTSEAFAPTCVAMGSLRRGVVDDIQSIPEPATLAVLGIGGLLALLRRRRA